VRSLAIDTRPLRESRDFRLLWCGQALSYLGNMITFVAVPYQLYALTGSPLQVGLLSICDAVPMLLFSAVGGTIADRLDRRKLISGQRPG
jgi:MFS family permease